jgi:hypothetical protein
VGAVFFDDASVRIMRIADTGNIVDKIGWIFQFSVNKSVKASIAELQNAFDKRFMPSVTPT